MTTSTGVLRRGRKGGITAPFVVEGGIKRGIKYQLTLGKFIVDVEV